MTQEQSSSPALDELITLCVGGSSFTITYQTLKKSPYFKRMIESDKDSVLYVNNNEICLDRSARLFEHILQYLRIDNLPVDNKSTFRELLVESEYYELPDMFQKVMDKLASTEKKHYVLLDWAQLTNSFNESSGHKGKLKKPFGGPYDIISALKFESLSIFRCLQHSPSTDCTCPRVHSKGDAYPINMFLVSKNKD